MPQEGTYPYEDADYHPCILRDGEFSTHERRFRVLKEAKTVYLVNDGASQGMMDDVAKELTKWGAFDLVDEAASDITITLSGLKPFKGWPMTSRTQGQIASSGLRRKNAASRTRFPPTS